MGTRGFVGEKKKGKIKGKYNHWDSYYSGLGEVALSAYYDNEWSRMYSLDGTKGERMGDSDFLTDGLFCEYGYVYNKDDDTLEVYRGFYKKPQWSKKGYKSHDNTEFYTHRVLVVDRRKHPREAVEEAFEDFESSENNKTDPYPEKEFLERWLASHEAELVERERKLRGAKSLLRPSEGFIFENPGYVVPDRPLVLDLFAGSKSVAKAFEAAGFDTVTLDFEARYDPDICVDILKWDYRSALQRQPDVIWASPPCTTFSVASIGHHWGGGRRAYEPKTPEAVIGKAIAERTVEIIQYFRPKFWFIENPRGVLRKMPFMQELNRNTIWYCKYGDIRAKPTDIWYGSWPVGMPIRSCRNYSQAQKNGLAPRHCHHESAPRGAKTGTQGLKGAFERSRIPDEFCRLLADNVLGNLRTMSPEIMSPETNPRREPTHFRRLKHGKACSYCRGTGRGQGEPYCTHCTGTGVCRSNLCTECDFGTYL